jgi:short-subunit dehydrogenase
MNKAIKYALVTGASSGIGWHISEALARLGYSIIAVSNQPTLLDELKKQLEQRYPVEIEPINIDLAQEKAAEQIFDHCERQMMEVEVLVNNAGMLVFGETMQADYSCMNTILNLHMITPALLCRLFGEKMVMRRKGFILNVSSISAVMPYPGISLYGPTKAFIRYFTRALRTEMKLYGIKITCLIPGATATGLYDQHNLNIPLLMKLGVVKKPEVVAKAGVHSLFNNHAECIPGLMNKMIVLLLPFVPHVVIGLIHKRTDLVKKMV